MKKLGEPILEKVPWRRLDTNWFFTIFSKGKQLSWLKNLVFAFIYIYVPFEECCIQKGRSLLPREQIFTFNIRCQQTGGATKHFSQGCPSFWVYPVPLKWYKKINNKPCNCLWMANWKYICKASQTKFGIYLKVLSI